MIRSLIFLLSFQGAGEIIARLFALPVPGPVIGLVLLLVFLIRRGKIDAPINAEAGAFSGLAMGMGMHGVAGALLIPLEVGRIV